MNAECGDTRGVSARGTLWRFLIGRFYRSAVEIYADCDVLIIFTERWLFQLRSATRFYANFRVPTGKREKVFFSKFRRLLTVRGVGIM